MEAWAAGILWVGTIAGIIFLASRKNAGERKVLRWIGIAALAALALVLAGYLAFTVLFVSAIA